MRLFPAPSRPVLREVRSGAAGRRLLARALAVGVLTGLAQAAAPSALAQPVGCADPVALPIQNGGFEDPAQPPFRAIRVTELPGWTVSGVVTQSGPTATFPSGSQAVILGRPTDSDPSEGSVSQVLDGTTLGGTTVTLQITSLSSGTVSLGGRSQPVAGSNAGEQTHTVTFDVPVDAPADLELTLASDVASADNRFFIDVISGSSVSCNQAPVAVGDTASTVQNTPLSVPAPGVLGNDTDADSDPLTAAPITGPAAGTVALAADGAFTYTPSAGFVGADSFTYTASDGTATSQPATVRITVTAATCDITPPPGSIVGTSGNNTLNGTAGNDLIYALGGNDIVNGRGGDDLICGGPGNDAVSGGDGNDRVFGGDGNDTVSGGDGNDQVSGEAGNDAVNGDGGDDTLSGGGGNDALNGGPGTNSVDGGPGNDACRNPGTGPGCP